jgi:mRNA interferase MazF
MPEPGPWIPDRTEVIWINHSPQYGVEMKSMHPFVVLSPKSFNDKMSLILGLPMTTAEYNAENPFAVPAGTASDGKTSYILCHQPKSFDWRARKASLHPMGRIPEDPFLRASRILNRILEL